MEIGSWTLTGPKLNQPRPSWVALVIAFFLAAETFLEVAAVYPPYMSALAIGGSLWAAWMGVRRRALLAFALPTVSLAWLNPLLGGDWFSRTGFELYASHAALAMLFAVAAYTFLATERTK
jgi:hypothetical protein